MDEAPTSIRRIVHWALAHILTVFTLLILPMDGLLAREETRSKLEAAFIYQFTHYIEWSTLETEAPSFLISVIGQSPLLSELEELAKTKKAKNRKIEIHSSPDDSLLRKSQIVVITESNESLLRDVARKTRGVDILIISHAPGFAKKGAVINFFMEAGRLRFEISRIALEERKLKVSSQLLKLARIAEGNTEGGESR